MRVGEIDARGFWSEGNGKGWASEKEKKKKKKKKKKRPQGTAKKQAHPSKDTAAAKNPIAHKLSSPKTI
jgi:hypothetical protein